MTLALPLCLLMLQGGSLFGEGAEPLRSAPIAGQIVVRVMDVEGEQRCTVRANGVRVKRVLDDLAYKLGLKFSAHPSVDDSRLVTVDLMERKPADVLEFMCGSVELEYDWSGNMLTVAPLSNELDDAQTALMTAKSELLKATRRFPNSPHAPLAFMDLAEIAESLDNVAESQAHYDKVVADYPESSVVEDALLFSGRLYKRERNFLSAADRFEQLISRDSDDYTAIAWLELAACRVELLQPELAFSILSVLDREFPSSDPMVNAERKLVLAGAYNLEHNWFAALEAANEADLPPGSPYEKAVAKIRALALEGIGRKDQAAQSWLMYASNGFPAEKRIGYAQAALLSLEDSNALSVKFIVAQAAKDGIQTEELDSYERQADALLGIEGPEEVDLSVSAQLDRFERLIDERYFERVVNPLDELFRTRSALEPSDGLRTVTLWARLSAARLGVEEGLDILSTARRRLASIEDRRVLDLEAARILEQADRWAEAANAYSGRY